MHFTFLNESLELGLLSLLYVQSANIAFVDTFAEPLILATLVLVTLSHVIDELQGVKQDVFLSLIELQIGLEIMI